MRTPIFTRYWRQAVIVLVACLVISTFAIANIGGETPLLKKITRAFSSDRVCPKDLSGVLTAPLMEPKYISGLTPLGNINPPGHTSPVDHIYFATEFTGKIPLPAPAVATITDITEILKADSSGKYLATGYVVRFVVCDGLVLDFANYTDLIKPLKDQLAKQKSNCKYGIVKPGHTGGPEGQCYYTVHFATKAGQIIGWVQAVQTDQRLDLPFEIWAANYNKPARTDVNWDFYNDDRYAHSMCLFDLYAGDLKKEFYAKFTRTIAPICGQVNQDIVGTIQGMWYGGSSKEKDLEFKGKGLAFLHNNFDPRQGEISIGGNIIDRAGVITFLPTHVGKIDREPSEVKSGIIYCYNSDQNGWSPGGKILAQLVDNHHLKVEHLTGICGSNDVFQKPFIYQR